MRVRKTTKFPICSFIGRNANLRKIWKYPTIANLYTIGHQTFFRHNIFGLEYVLSHFIMLLVQIIAVLLRYLCSLNSRFPHILLWFLSSKWYEAKGSNGTALGTRYMIHLPNLLVCGAVFRWWFVSHHIQNGSIVNLLNLKIWCAKTSDLFLDNGKWSNVMIWISFEIIGR